MRNKIADLNPNDRNIGYQILLLLYKRRYAGEGIQVAGVEPKKRDHWWSILEELQDLGYLEFKEKKMEFKKDIIFSYSIKPKPEGINAVRDTIEARSRRVQNIINIVLTAIIAVLTAINIWLSYKVIMGGSTGPIAGAIEKSIPAVD